MFVLLGTADDEGTWVVATSQDGDKLEKLQAETEAKEEAYLEEYKEYAKRMAPIRDEASREIQAYLKANPFPEERVHFKLPTPKVELKTKEEHEARRIAKEEHEKKFQAYNQRFYAYLDTITQRVREDLAKKYSFDVKDFDGPRYPPSDNSYWIVEAKEI